MLIHTQKEKESEELEIVHESRFPLHFFQKILGPPPFWPPLPSSTFVNFVSLPPPFYWHPFQNVKSSLPLSENLKLLLGCQYGHIIVRRIHTKLISCAKIFLLLTSTRNTKDLAKIVDNLSFYFGNLGTVIFKEHLSLPLSTTEFLL